MPASQLHGLKAGNQPTGLAPSRVSPRDEKDDLKQRCPLPILMRHLGFGAHAVPNCKSPFRKDNKPSWGIFQRDGNWFYKDHGTDECGDELDFLAQLLRLERDKNFTLLVSLYRAIAECQPMEQVSVAVEATGPTPPPDKSGFIAGTITQHLKLASLRGLDLDGLQWATERGILVFGNWNGFEVFGVTDQSGKVLEVRRLDGQWFAATGSLPERKSHAIKGSQKSWPVGIEEARNCPCIALVEGLPDLLAAHSLVWQEQTSGGHKFIECAPVGMLSASGAISPEALPKFGGKGVVIFPHADDAGGKAAVRWRDQLQEIATEVLIFDMPTVSAASVEPVKDLNDLARVRNGELLTKFPALSTIMPRT